MNDLDNFIKEINLVFTNTIDKYEFCRVGFNIDDVNVNYDGSISLYELVSSFNKLYLNFKKDYEQLDKIQFGKYLQFGNFFKSEREDCDYMELMFYVDEPYVCNHSETLLYLVSENSVISSFVTNGINPFDKNYYFEYIELDSNKAKQYLDLFEKYQALLATYQSLKCSFLFGDGTNVIFTEIGGELIDELNFFRLSFGSAFIDTEYFVKLIAKLGEQLVVDYDNSEIILDSKNEDVNEDVVNKLLKDVFVHKKYLRKR